MARRELEIWHNRPDAVRSVTTAVSTSPAAPIAGSTRQDAAAVDRDRLLAQQEPRHVQVVDHHVAKQSAGGRDIGRRRRRRIAADDGQQFQRADLAGVQPLLQRREMRIEAPVEPDHQHDAGAAHGGEAARTRSADRSIGFSQNTARPGGGRLLDVIGVRRRRRARSAPRRPRIASSTLIARAPQRAGEACRRRGIRVGDPGQARARMRGDVAGVDPPDPAGAQHGDVQHGVAPPVATGCAIAAGYVDWHPSGRTIHGHDPADRRAGAGALSRGATHRMDGGEVPLFAGVWAIFGHGNVAALGEALHAHARRTADLPRAQRAGDGARRDRLCQGDRGGGG